MNDQRGLYGKYRVERVDGKPVNWAFVLQDTDIFTPTALRAYADACMNAYPELAIDLFEAADQIDHQFIDQERR